MVIRMVQTTAHGLYHTYNHQDPLFLDATKEPVAFYNLTGQA
jgi:hypothetical protein